MDQEADCTDPEMLAIAEAAGAQYPGKSGPPVGVSSPTPLCLGRSTYAAREFVHSHKKRRRSFLFCALGKERGVITAEMERANGYCRK